MTESGESAPSFPRLEPAQTVRLQREWSAISWTGSVDRVLAVQREVERLLESAYDAEIARLPRDAEFDSAARMLGERLRLRVKVTGNKGKLSRGGELSAIFAEMDVTEIETISLSNDAAGASLPSLSVEFRSGSDSFSKPVEVKVAGSDRQWVGGAIEILSAELGKGVPWWSFFRRGYVAAILGVLTTWGVGGAVVWSQDPEDKGAAVAVVAMMGGLGLVFGVILFGAILNKMFPGFEVLESGTPPTGKRMLAAIVTALGVGSGIAGVVLGFLAL